MAAVRCEILCSMARLITLRKRVLKDAEEFVGHFRFRPQKRLQTLHPL